MTDTTTLDTGDQQQPQKRPVFLTVLCILTWVGSGFSLLSGLIGLITGPGEEYAEIMNTPDASGMLDGLASFEDFLFWSNVSNGVGIGVAILCILGAVFMFQQKKMGFFLYTGGSIIGVIIAAVAMNVLMPPMLAWVGYIMVVLSGVISAAFIIMYAVNLKHMN
ncbi:MAG: hypothetical protein Crog4KO_02010 [Crocinitomicaceae bacterium]